LRPVEPDFDGSNPDYDAVTGPWDVDNDGDGIRDSVWADLGFPVQTARDGRGYAIWITVGYFEVEPNLVKGVMVWDALHPDGRRVAQEIGLDTGEVERHRAFYLVDRSIPVAFEPGENHNVDRCILVRRYVE
jgi:hypothetical protein